MGDVAVNWNQPNWYVLFVRSNQEKKVSSGLAQRGVEHFLPCYESVHQWKDRRVKLQVPLFSGYLFVRLPLTERVTALSVPNVVSLVGPKNCPSAISETEIAWIRSGVEHGRAKPWLDLALGQRVVITAGVLSGLEGTLIRKHASARVVISISSIARSFVVEVDEAFVRPVGASRVEIGRANSTCDHNTFLANHTAGATHVQ